LACSTWKPLFSKKTAIVCRTKGSSSTIKRVDLGKRVSIRYRIRGFSLLFERGNVDTFYAGYS